MKRAVGWLGWLILTACSAPGPVAQAAVATELPVHAQDLRTGKPIDWQAWRGRVVLVDLWASWCDTCREAMPHHAALWQRYRDQGFDVLAVSVDEDRALAERFVSEVPMPFTVAWDQGQRTADAVKPREMPTAYLVDRQGRVLLVAQGGGAAALAEIDQALAKALAERGVAGP